MRWRKLYRNISKKPYNCIEKFKNTQKNDKKTFTIAAGVIAIWHI